MPRRPSSSWEGSFPYEVDYNDHFETPLHAYRDIAPMIDWIVHPPTGAAEGASRRSRSTTTLYDPYYCNGRSSVFLQSLGYQVQHAKRDFYNDIRHNCVPSFDVLVTNPPYSDQHKQLCLDYCATSLQHHGRSFFLLMPSYVTSRAYYRTFLNEHNLHDHILYLAPRVEYQYEHPEGTGHASSPFASLWICGMTRRNVDTVLSKWNEPPLLEHANTHNPNTTTSTERPHLYRKLTELEAAGLISTQKRPNPHQRRKKRKRPEEDPAASEALPSGKAHSSKTLKSTPARPSNPPSCPGTTTTTTPQPVTTKSKYRDETGKRRKKRF